MKKGDPAECVNYLPISLLCSSYKLFAIILLNRLRAANIDDYICATQFGFKKGARVTDALFMARRFIDNAHAKPHGQLVLLALDWAKAFDSLMPGPMLNALRRFGLPVEFVNMIASIYDSRSFFVRDNNADSNIKSQFAGISQGCPLSPVLFVITMSIVIADSRATLVETIGHSANVVSEILYADDTLIVDESCDFAQLYMDIIADQGNRYGLSFNWDKIEYICISYDLSRK